MFLNKQKQSQFIALFCLLAILFTVFTWQIEVSPWFVFFFVSLLLVRKKLTYEKATHKMVGIDIDEIKPFSYEVLKALKPILSVLLLSLGCLLTLVWWLGRQRISPGAEDRVFALENSLLALRDVLGEVKELGTLRDKILLAVTLVIGACLVKAITGSEGWVKNASEGIKTFTKYLGRVALFLIPFVTFTLFAFPYGNAIAKDRLRETLTEVQIVKRSNEQARMTRDVLRNLAESTEEAKQENNLRALTSHIEASRQFFRATPQYYAGYDFYPIGSPPPPPGGPGPKPRPPSSPDDPDNPWDTSGGRFPIAVSESGKRIRQYGIQLSSRDLGEIIANCYLDESTQERPQPTPIDFIPVPEEAQLSIRKVATEELQQVKAEGEMLATEVKEQETVCTGQFKDLVEEVAKLDIKVHPLLQPIVNKIQSILVERTTSKILASDAVKRAQTILLEPAKRWLEIQKHLYEMSEALKQGDWNTADTALTNLRDVSAEYYNNSKEVSNARPRIAKLIASDALQHARNESWSSAMEAVVVFETRYPDLLELRPSELDTLIFNAQQKGNQPEIDSGCADLFASANNLQEARGNFADTFNQIVSLPNGKRYVVPEALIQQDRNRGPQIELKQSVPEKSLISQMVSLGVGGFCPKCGGPCRFRVRL